MAAGVGESSKDLLANLQECARELLKAAVEAQVRSEPKLSIDGAKLPRSVALKREKEALLREQIEAKIELELREQLAAEPSNEVGDEQTVRERIKEVESALEKTRSQLNQDNHVLEYLQTRDSLSRLTATSSNDVTTTLSEQRGLVSEVCCCSEELQRVNQELVSVQRERRECQQHCRVLMKRLEELQNSDVPQDNTEGDNDSLQESLRRCRSEVCLLTHTLQSLIVASGVNWSKDSELMELTLKLGNVDNWTKH